MRGDATRFRLDAWAGLSAEGSVIGPSWEGIVSWFMVVVRWQLPLLELVFALVRGFYRLQ